MKDKCEDCVYCNQKKEFKETKGVWMEEIQVLTCRRYPPSMSGFPAIEPEEWCGEYTPKEEF